MEKVIKKSKLYTVFIEGGSDEDETIYQIGENVNKISEIQFLKIFNLTIKMNLSY